MSEPEDKDSSPPFKSAEDLVQDFRESSKRRAVPRPGRGIHKLEKLQPRHRLLATLLANGISPVDAAPQVGCSLRTIRRIQADPVFKEFLAQVQARIVEKTADDAVSLVMEDAKANVKFLRDTRDGKVVDDPRMLRERLKASSILFDRQMPRKMEQKTEATHIIRIEGSMMAGFARIMSEDDKGNRLPPIDAEYEALPSPEEAADGGVGEDGALPGGGSSVPPQGVEAPVPGDAVEEQGEPPPVLEDPKRQ